MNEPRISNPSFVYRNLVFRNKQSEKLIHSRLDIHVVESELKRSEWLKLKLILVNQKKKLSILKMSQTLKHTNNPINSTRQNSFRTARDSNIRKVIYLSWPSD